MRQLRVLALAPSLILTALLVSACASTPARPPAPISSGDPRVDPQPPRTAETDRPDKPDREAGSEEDEAEARLLTPPHMAGREIVRAGVLLPFSHPNRRVREEAQAMLAGIEMALFEQGGSDFLIIPRDTAGTTAGAEDALEEVLDDGAEVILGPLFAANVRAVTPIAREAGAPVIAFSNDPAAAGGGAYLASFTVEEEVTRLVELAVADGTYQFAFLGPRSDYGQRVERALRFEAIRLGANVVASEFYDPSNDAPVDEARALAQMLAPMVNGARGRRPVAVMIPESGVKLRAVAPLLPYHGVDFRRLRFLGTSQWNDPQVWREPTLDGAWFAVARTEETTRFETSYRRIYGQAPTDLAGLGYDAASLAIGLSDAGRLDFGGITDPDGFVGVNGLFRFRVDGTPQRALSVMEIDTADGAVILAPAPNDFDPDIG